MIGSIGLLLLIGALCAVGLWAERRAYRKNRSRHLRQTGYKFTERE